MHFNHKNVTKQFFPFENWQAEISRMLARIQSSNVELLYIQQELEVRSTLQTLSLLRPVIQILIFTLVSCHDLLC